MEENSVLSTLLDADAYTVLRPDCIPSTRRKPNEDNRTAYQMPQ